jgi:hypothetical protein
LELGECHLAHLKLHPCHLVGLGLDVGLLQLQLRLALADLLLDTGVLLVYPGGIVLQLLDQLFRFCHRQWWLRRGWQAGWEDEQRAQCHRDQPEHSDT